MQQTQTYKLNKPGMDDRFSVEPLNENMDKVEAALLENGQAHFALHAAIAATDGRHVIDKLLTITAADGSTESAIDLSGIDMSQYGALVLVYSIDRAQPNTKLYLNNQQVVVLIPGADSISDGGGIAILIPAGGTVYSFAICTSSKSAGDIYRGRTVMDWNPLPTLRLSHFANSSAMMVYGLRR